MAEQSRGKKAKGSVLSIWHAAVLSLSSKGSPTLPSAALDTSMASTRCVCVCVCVCVTECKCEHRYIIIIAAAKWLQSCPTLCDPIDGSPRGSPVPEILQARTLESVAVAFSNAGN